MRLIRWSHDSPVLAVFTGLKFTEYERRVVANNYDHTCVLLNPANSLTEAYKTEFSRPGDKTEIHGDFHIFETKATKTIISVRDLTSKDPADYKGKTLFCKGQISIIGRDGWWYRCCPEELGDKYVCNVLGTRIGIPCYRVNTVIQDDFSDVTITVMGNQAEQLFGCKLDVLRSKHLYLTEQTIPPEIQATIGQVHIFELKGSTYGDCWNVVGITTPPEEPGVTLETTGASSSAPEPSLQTPDKACIERKHNSDTDTEAPFEACKEKKTRRGLDFSSTSDVVEKKQARLRKRMNFLFSALPIDCQLIH